GTQELPPHAGRRCPEGTAAFPSERRCSANLPRSCASASLQVEQEVYHEAAADVDPFRLTQVRQHLLIVASVLFECITENRQQFVVQVSIGQRTLLVSRQCQLRHRRCQPRWGERDGAEGERAEDVAQEVRVRSFLRRFFVSNYVLRYAKNVSN